MWIALLKALSARLQIERVFLRGGKVVFRFSPSATIDGAKLVFALNKAKSDLVLQRSGTGTVLLLNRAGEPEQLMELAVDALEKLDFVLEADQLQFKRGYTAFVNATTNFISLHDAHATVQVAPFNGGGPNGVGGITLDGKASNIKMETDKRGNVFFTMNVMGVGISARVTISLTKGSNKASATIYPNFHSNNITLLGELMPAEDSSVFKGQSF